MARPFFIFRVNELPKLLQKMEELFNGILGTRKIDPVDFTLKEDVNPICSRPYPVLKVHEEIKKGSQKFSSTRSPRKSKQIIMGSPILHRT